jgi:hypothetical protein
MALTSALAAGASCVAADDGAFFFGRFFLAAGFAGAGIFMPGMSIDWAVAGTPDVPNVIVVQRTNGRIFTQTPRKCGVHPRWPAEGAFSDGLAVAVLARAGIAAAAALGAAAGCGDVLTILHFPVSFFVARSERIAI